MYSIHFSGISKEFRTTDQKIIEVTGIIFSMIEPKFITTGESPDCLKFDASIPKHISEKKRYCTYETNLIVKFFAGTIFLRSGNTMKIIKLKKT